MLLGDRRGGGRGGVEGKRSIAVGWGPRQVRVWTSSCAYVNHFVLDSGSNRLAHHLGDSE